MKKVNNKNCNNCIYQDLQYSKLLNTYISSCNRSGDCNFKQKSMKDKNKNGKK